MSTQQTRNWSWAQTTLRPVLRFVTAGLLLGPGVSKFVTSERSVRYFRDLGLPSPELLVPLVGLLELLAAVLLVVDRASWLGALVATPIVIVAAITAGPTWQNVGVLCAAVLLVALEIQAVYAHT